MNSYKKLFLNLPEYLLIAAVIFYYMSASVTINYIAFGLLVAIVLQMIIRNKAVGIIVPCVIIFICIYMIMALISEVREFPSFNSDAQTLLFVGLAYFLITIAASIIMIYKYATLSTRKIS